MPKQRHAILAKFAHDSAIEKKWQHGSGFQEVTGYSKSAIEITYPMEDSYQHEKNQATLVMGRRQV